MRHGVAVSDALPSIASILPQHRVRHAVVLAENYGLGQVVLDSLHAYKVKTWLVCSNRRGAGSLRFSRHARTLLCVEDALEKHGDEIVAAINGLHQKHYVDVVMASDVASSMTLGTLTERIGPEVFPVSDRTTLHRLDDKWEFYNLCQKLGIATPKSFLFPGDGIDVPQVEQELRFPVVVKPTDQDGNRGLFVMQSPDQLLRHTASSRRTWPHVIVQDFIAGTDVGLSLLAREGEVSLSTTFHCGPKFRTEIAEIPALTAECHRMIKHLRFTGVANFDGRLCPNGDIVLLECNPRFFIRVNLLRLAGIHYLGAGIPGLRTNDQLGSRIVFSRTDREGLWRSLSDRSVRRMMIRRWYELLTDPLPPVIDKLQACGRRPPG